MNIRSMGTQAIGWMAMTASLAAHAAAPATIERFEVSARVRVAASGEVEDVQVRGDRDPRIAAHVEQAVRALEIKPATRDGRALPAETTMGFIAAIERGEAGKSAITTRYTGHGPEFAHQVIPDFPRLRRNASVQCAEVLLDVQVGADGRVTDVRTNEVITVQSGDTGRFEAAAKAAALRWRFNVEKLDGQPLASAVQVPVIFTHNPGETAQIARRHRELHPEEASAALDSQPVALANATGLAVID